MLAAGVQNLWLDEARFRHGRSAQTVQAFAGRLHEAVEVCRSRKEGEIEESAIRNPKSEIEGG